MYAMCAIITHVSTPVEPYHHEYSPFAKSMQNKLNHLKFAICIETECTQSHHICYLWKVVIFKCK